MSKYPWISLFLMLTIAVQGIFGAASLVSLVTLLAASPYYLDCPNGGEKQHAIGV